MGTALLEGRLIELVIRLDWQADQSAMFEDLQAKYGGSHGGELKRKVQDLAQAIGTGLDQASFAEFIDRVAQRQDERNTSRMACYSRCPASTRSGSGRFRRSSVRPLTRSRSSRSWLRGDSKKICGWSRRSRRRRWTGWADFRVRRSVTHRRTRPASAVIVVAATGTYCSHFHRSCLSLVRCEQGRYARAARRGFGDAARLPRTRTARIRHGLRADKSGATLWPAPRDRKPGS